MDNIRTLILPDIHNHWEKAEKIIKHEAPDKIVFLGDYFDNFGDNYIVATKTAKWLLGSLKKKNRIHLMGNHDANYAFKGFEYKCSGYDLSKDYSISKIITTKHWKRLPLFTWVGSWLCSHAGVHSSFHERYGKNTTLNKWLTNVCEESLNNAFKNGPPRPILKAGHYRGGSQPIGGIYWSDFGEFDSIKGVNQIFGHTPIPYPMWVEDENSRNLCLDVNNCDFYAIHDSATDDVKTFSIKEIE